MSRLVAVLVALIAPITVASHGSVHADPPSCVLGRRTRCKIISPGGGNGSGTTGSGGGGQAVYRWTRTNLGIDALDPYSIYSCPSRTADFEDRGALFRIEMYLIATGEKVWTGWECAYFDDEIPQPPPPPPTPDEILEDSVPLLTVEPQIMPPPAGTSAAGGTSFGALVNRSMWAWCDQPGPVILELELRGWRAVATMEVVAMKWSVNGGGASTTTGGKACGTAPGLGTNGKGAAWTWTPKRKGGYTISLTAVWTGEAQFSYQGTPAGTVWLGEQEYTETVDQTVVEMQALNR